MTQQELQYIDSVIGLYLGLPDTPCRASRYDRALALSLYRKRTPLSTVEAAIVLATARRQFRDPNASKLAPIRSLHYFLPVIEEITSCPLPPAYVNHLRLKLAKLSIYSKPTLDNGAFVVHPR